MPLSSRALQSPFTPIFGAPSTPAWWHDAHTACTTCSPDRGSPAPAASAAAWVASPPTFTRPTGVRRSSTAACCMPSALRSALVSV